MQPANPSFGAFYQGCYLFPGKLQAIRSQYPFIVVMILFTMASLYLVSLPGMEPVYVPG